MEANAKRLGDMLVRRGAMPQDRVDELFKAAEEKSLRFIDLVLSRPDDGPKALAAFAAEFGYPFYDKLKPEDIDPALVELVPINFARQHRVLPIAEQSRGFGRNVTVVAVADPMDLAPLDDLRAFLGKELEPWVVPGEMVEDVINRVYERKEEAALGEAKEGEEVEELQDLIDMTDEAPVIRWVNNLFYNAVRDRASDIHIEPTDREVVVRNRIDGNLYPVKTAHKGFLSSIVSRVKIEAGLNIAEKRLPQDGRITKKIQGRLIDVRVSTIPTAKGERIVMRLLDKEKVLLDLRDLGYAGAQLDVISFLLTRPNGILLVTGPTGSGKTTTLYAGLSQINQPDLNILTAEDPVEYELRGIGQMQVQPKIGLTFAAALRAFLRQDPDVIMVGEIRDHETAEIAIHASLTGHLVLSTLHTNDAAGAITRLGEMGVQPYLITSSLVGVIAQRLVRKLCSTCREPYAPSDEDFRSLGVERGRLMQVLTSVGIQPVPGVEFRESNFAAMPGKAQFYRPKGCEACTMTGYRGRIAIAEILIIDEPVKREILNQSDAGTITKNAVTRGMRTLREDGARLVVQGITSLEEVLAATQAGEIEMEPS